MTNIKNWKYTVMGININKDHGVILLHDIEEDLLIPAFRKEIRKVKIDYNDPRYKIVFMAEPRDYDLTKEEIEEAVELRIRENKIAEALGWENDWPDLLL